MTRIFTLTAALLAAALGSAAQTPAPPRPAGAIFYPGAVAAADPMAPDLRRPADLTVAGRSVQYSWNPQTSRWQGGFLTTSTYNALGQPIKRVDSDSLTNTPISQSLLAYDAQGRLSEVVAQNWDGTAHVNYSRAQYGYDAQGYRTLDVYSTWQNNAWVMRTGTRITTTYNAAGTLTSETYEDWQQPTNTWVPSGRYRHLVNAATNQWTASEYDYWDVPTSTYINDYHMYNITWYNWPKRQASYYEEQHRNGSTGAWYHDARTTVAYQANGSYTGILQVADVPGVWVNDTRYTTTYDQYGNTLQLQIEGWANNDWYINIGQRSLLSYTPDGLVRRAVRQAHNRANGSFDNVQLETYGNFITLASRQATALAAAAALYPNPTTNSATLTLKGVRDQGPVQVDILNALGQPVQVLTVRPQQGTISQELSLAALPTGLYLVRLKLAEGTVTKRLVRQ